MPDRVVLITGATGFLGGALCALLLARGSRLLAIVRGSSAQHAQQRLLASLARFLPDGQAESLLDQVEIIVGDAADPSTFESDAFHRATHVVHAAACTSFRSTREAWRSNVTATRLLADRMACVPNLERFLYVGTAYCCGAHPSPIVREDDSPRASHSYINEYTRTKAECETLLRSFADRLKLTIARPSVIVGHTALGVAPSSSLFWYYRALAALAVSPFAAGSRRDVVPVDYVAEALEFLLNLPHPRYCCYHLSAGESCSVAFEAIMRAFGVESPCPTVTPAELGGMVAAVEPLVGAPEQAAKVVRGLAACAEYAQLRVDWFDNERLISEGFRKPPRFTDYLPRCLSTVGSKSIYDQMVDDA